VKCRFGDIAGTWRLSVLTPLLVSHVMGVNKKWLEEGNLQQVRRGLRAASVPSLLTDVTDLGFGIFKIKPDGGSNLLHSKNLTVDSSSPPFFLMYLRCR